MNSVFCWFPIRMIIFNCCLVNFTDVLKKWHIIPKKWHVTWSTDLTDMCDFYLNILLVQQIFNWPYYTLFTFKADWIIGGGGKLLKKPSCGTRHYLGWYPCTSTQIEWSKWHHNPEDRNILSYQCENRKSYLYFIMLAHHSLWLIKLDKNFTEQRGTRTNAKLIFD